MNDIKIILKWAKDLFPICRSITGDGLRYTLLYLKRVAPNLKILKFKSGQKCFDWTIPKEWNIDDAFLMHLKTKKKYAQFKKNNLHIMGYSQPKNIILDLNKFKNRIYHNKKYPKYIPYVTSYYKADWGFCMSYNEFKKLKKGKYKISINSQLKNGEMNSGDLLIKGKSKKEILFSTYVCHPSLANNELSGPLLGIYIAKKLSEIKRLKYSYRFLFVPETIGSIAYISKNLTRLKKNVIAGYVLSCVGDNNNYSFISSRLENSLADQSLEAALIKKKNVRKYSYLERGSDERQYCSPGVDLPVAGFCRTKYGEYPEYHSSADNLKVINKKGFEGSYKIIKSIIDAFELGLKPKVKIKCEPQLGKRNLYFSPPREHSHNMVVMGLENHASERKVRMNILVYCDGKNNIFEISKKIKEPLEIVVSELKILEKNNLVKFQK